MNIRVSLELNCGRTTVPSNSTKLSFPIRFACNSRKIVLRFQIERGILRGSVKPHDRYTHLVPESGIILLVPDILSHFDEYIWRTIRVLLDRIRRAIRSNDAKNKWTAASLHKIPDVVGEHPFNRKWYKSALYLDARLLKMNDQSTLPILKCTPLSYLWRCEKTDDGYARASFEKLERSRA